MSVMLAQLSLVWQYAGVCVVVVVIGVVAMYGVPLVVRWVQVKRWGCIQGMIALSYDDGPDELTTVALLDLLDELDVSATFYLVGFRGERYPEVLARLGESRHELATHSHSHKNAWKRTPWFEYRDAMRAYTTLGSVVEAHDAYRPPFGKLTLPTLIGMWLKGRKVQWWTVASNDTKDSFDDPVTAAKGILDRGETVVLMHCHHSETHRREYVLGLTRALVEQSRARGIEPVTMRTLIGGQR